MLTMILEEPEGGGAHSEEKTDADSMPQSFHTKEENHTYPRRSRCPKSNFGNVDWFELLAKATEEDKKKNIDLTISSNDSESDNDAENQPSLIDLSKSTPKRSDPLILDLSSVNRTSQARFGRKEYTVPTYEPQYRAQNHLMRTGPLKELNSAGESRCNQRVPTVDAQEVDVAAKKSLFGSNHFYYQRETHSHVSIRESVKPYEVKQGDSGVSQRQPIAHPEKLPQKVTEHFVNDEVREYGHSNSSGFYSQLYSGHNPPHPAQYEYNSLAEANSTPVATGHHRLPNPLLDPPPEIVFAVPEPPQKYKPTTKEIVVNGKPYQILALLGKGGSSKVYLALAKDNSLLAIKCVNLGNVDEKTKMDHLNEIEHLMKMQYCKHIIKIIDHQYLPNRNLLYAVMERGDTDLSRLLKERTTSGEGIPPEMILFYWSEILLAVKSIHDNNIIHRDLKPANFLLVAGRLKLIDFGIASAIQSEQTSVFKDSQSGTPNYMSPEACEDLGVGDQRLVRIGRKSDVWSLGCILYTFLYGKTPFQEYNHPMAKFRAITNPNYQIQFPKVRGVPEILIDSCRKCLIYDKDRRASIEQLLELKSQILMTPLEVVRRLRPVLDDTAFENAKIAIMSQEGGEYNRKSTKPDWK